MKKQKTEAELWWKKFYRLQRIAIRESNKTFVDTIIYGTGCVLIDNTGEAKRISPSDYCLDLIR